MVSTDVTFFENTHFFSVSPSEQTEDDDWLIYTTTSIVATDSNSPPLQRPPIHHVYSRRLVSNDSCHAPMASSSSDSSPDLDLPIAIQKGKHQCTYPISSFVSYDHLSPSSYSFIASIDAIIIPKTLHEALSHSGWRQAMIEEMNALEANGTWKLIELPTGKKVSDVNGYLPSKSIRMGWWLALKPV